jgi:hypothetical protein
VDLESDELSLDEEEFDEVALGGEELVALILYDTPFRWPSILLSSSPLVTIELELKPIDAVPVAVALKDT